MKKFIIGMVMFTILLMFGALAFTNTVNLDPTGVLLNNSWQSSSTVTPNFNLSRNASTWNCYLYGNLNTSGTLNYTQLQTSSNVANDTNIDFSGYTLDDVVGKTYCWDVQCNGTFLPFGVWGARSNTTTCNITGYNFSIDATAPSMTETNLTALLGGAIVFEWIDYLDTNDSIELGLRVTDSNPGYCDAYMDYDIAVSNASTYNRSFQNMTAYTTDLVFKFGNVNETTGFVDNATGYHWYITCNDSAGNSASLNGTFKVDTTLPGVFDFNTSRFGTNNRFLPISSANSTATDYEPRISWGNTIEANFQRYEISASIGRMYNTTGRVWQNVTTITTYWLNFSRLLGDKHYVFNITAFDDAGNKRQMTSATFGYSTDSTNHELSAGWNIIGNVGNSFSLSAILNWTSASTASIWNSSHQFTSHVSSGSNGAITVTAGTPVLLYMASAGNVSDLIHNTTAFSGFIENLTNQTASDWNLVMNRLNSTVVNSTQHTTSIVKFQWLDNQQNGGHLVPQNNSESNVTFFSFHNNSASSGRKYVSMVGNWSIFSDNDTALEFGECLWMFVGKTDGFNQTVNWGTINKSMPCYDCH